MLIGLLGTSKTTLVRGLARGLGLSAEVTSQTYGLIHECTTLEGVFVHINVTACLIPRTLGA